MRKETAGTPDPIDIQVGARVRIVRKQKGLSQSAVAEACGVSFQQQQKRERGQNRIAASDLVKTARALDVRPSTLLGENDGDVGSLTGAVIKGAPGLLTAFERLSARGRAALVLVAQQLAEAGA